MTYPSQHLSPALIQQIITDEEIPLRCHSLPADVVDIVYRYGNIIGCVIEPHKELSRGMDRARSLIHESIKAGKSIVSGTTILAEKMTDSKGRFQRIWYAPTGGLWLTVIVADTLMPEQSRLYPLAAGTACCETLRHYDIPANIKWVNDVHVAGKKNAGILAETEFNTANSEQYILIGIGINVNNDSFPPEIEKLATSMKTQLGRNIDITLLAARLLAKLAWSVGLLHYDEQIMLEQRGLQENTKPGQHLLSLWNTLSDSANRRVLFGYDVQEKPLYEAISRGVDANGALILEHPDGTTTLENSGEILYL